MDLSTIVSQNIQKEIDSCSYLSIIQDKQGICLLVNNKHASCLVSLFGGHILSFIPKHDNKDRLWLSPKAIFDGKTPIRGGVPICWPWFSAHSTQHDFPSHGFVRNQYWQLTNIDETDNSTIILSLSPQTTALYGYDGLSCKLQIEISDSLSISLISMNSSHEMIELTQALHSYFSIPEIDKVSIIGLKENYYDKTNNSKNNECPNNYTIQCEVDRIHECKHDDYTEQQSVTLTNANQSTIVSITQSGHDSTVVWNPWQDKSRSMKDMSDEGYQEMLCIEAANTSMAQPVLKLMPGQIHKLSQVIK